MAKGFIEKEGIDFNETFSVVLIKDSFRDIMVFIAQYNLESHQYRCEDNVSKW